MDFSRLLVWCFDLLAHLPLSALHRLGSLMGWLMYWGSASYANRLRENLSSGLARQNYSKTTTRTILHANISQSGQGIMELPWVWRQPIKKVVSKVTECHGWDHVEALHAQGKGVIVLTPHFGCFEMIGLYIATRLPMTCLYRRPRWPFLDTLMHEGRERGLMKLAPADLGGVRQLLKALKRGEIIGVLPDQVPSNGEGEWIPFFGRPAYTMTLIGKLVQASGAGVVMCQTERLPDGKGYTMRFIPLPLDLTMPAANQINRALEEVILSCPEQYLWSYNRYKVPAGVAAPITEKAPS